MNFFIRELAKIIERYHETGFHAKTLFLKSVPILITVDLCSSAIVLMELADSGNADDWKNHFECLSNNGIEAIYLVSDDGADIRAGHAKVMSDKLSQLDTYHGIAHNLGMSKP